MAAMSDFELTERGDGHFELKGEMSFNTAEQILRASEKLFQRRTRIGTDLSAVTRTDSAGLALLLEWIGRAHQSGSEISFSTVPEKLRAIAETADVQQLL